MAPFTPALLRSLSAGSLAGGTSRTSAPLLALSTGPMMFPAPWQVPGGPRSLRLVPKFRLTSLGSYSGGAVLALVWPVVPYTLALSSACSAGWCLRKCALQYFPCRPVASQASYRRVAFHPCCSTLLLKLEVFQKVSNYQEYTKHDNLQSMPSLAPETID